MNIVLTLTTIPARVHNTTYRFDVRQAIKALGNLNHNEYEVHFNIPHNYSVTGEEYIVPDWLNEMSSNHSCLKIFRTEDYGSVTKLLPTVQRITDGDTIIITCDDDMVYHPELINEHVKNQDKWPDYLVGYDGIRSRNKDGNFGSHFKDSREHYFSATHRNSLVDILQAYKTISYKRRFFLDDFEQFIKEEGTWCDDTSISSYFAKHKRGRVVTYYSDDPGWESHDDWIGHLRHTFPIVRYTDHGSKEGCNLSRQSTDKDAYHKATQNLYKNYLDQCYKGLDLEI